MPHPGPVRALTIVICLLHAIATLLGTGALLTFGAKESDFGRTIIWAIVILPLSAIVFGLCFLAGQPWARSPWIAILAVTSLGLCALPFAAIALWPDTSSSSGSGGQIILLQGFAVIFTALAWGVCILFLALLPALSAWLLYTLTRPNIRAEFS